MFGDGKQLNLSSFQVDQVGWAAQCLQELGH